VPSDTFSNPAADFDHARHELLYCFFDKLIAIRKNFLSQSDACCKIIQTWYYPVLGKLLYYFSNCSVIWQRHLVS